MASSVRVDAQSEQEATPEGATSEEAISAGGAPQGEALRDSVAELGGGTTEPEPSTPAAGEQETTVAARLAFAEQSVGESAPQPPEEPLSPQPSSAAVPTGSAAPPRVAFEFPTATGPKIVIVDGAAASSITTGSLPAPPPPPITFGPATVRPAPAPVALHLGSGPSIEDLQRSWSLLSEQHHSVLQNLRPRYDTVGTGDSLRYQLIAGPIASAGEAKRVCALLRAKNVPCGVGPLVGEAL
jgi:hypothetical protein